MRIFRPLGAIAVALAACSGGAHAHHPAAAGNTGGAGPINTISATTLDPGQLAIAIMFETTRFGGLSDNGLIAAAMAGNHAHSMRAISSPSLNLAYGLAPDLMVSLRLPGVRRTNIREGHSEIEVHGHHVHIHNEIHERGNSTGVGDLTLLGQWRFLNRGATRTEMALIAGLKAPTGATNRYDRNGELFEAEFQPGSGSFDLIAGLAFTQRLNAVSFDANVLYVAVGEGAQRTDLGDRLVYNAALSWRVAGGPATGAGPGSRMNAGAHMHRHGGRPHTHEHEPAPQNLKAIAGPALDLVLEVNGEWHARQRIDGLADPNSGGNVVFLSPGIRYSQDNWSLFGSVGIPIIKDMNGIQSEPEVRFTSGFAVTF